MNFISSFTNLNLILLLILGSNHPAFAMLTQISTQELRKFIDVVETTKHDTLAMLKYFTNIKLSLAQGRSVDTVQALYFASQYGYLVMVQELLNYGANVNSSYGRWGGGSSTPLHAAVTSGHLKVVEELLLAGADPNCYTDPGLCCVEDSQTPLYQAAGQGDLEIVKLLLAAGANVNSLNRGSWGSTPLSAAAQCGHLEIVKELLKHGAKTEQADYYDQTSLYVASNYGHLEIVKKLLKHGAHVNSPHGRGAETSLHIACERGYLEIVKELLKHGAKINQLSSSQKNCGYPARTPLYNAVRNGNLEIVHLLLIAGADVNSLNESLNWGNNITPLFLACAQGNLEIVKELLNAGANFNLSSSRGIPPLEIASINKHQAVVHELKKWNSSTTA
jgi:ankyrin repeat protein